MAHDKVILAPSVDVLTMICVKEKFIGKMVIILQL
jgi:hypothetical protein